MSRWLRALACSLLIGLAGNALAADLGISGYTWTPDPVVRGGTSTFTVDVTNFDYSASVSDLTMTADLPGNVDFAGSTPPAGCAFNLGATPKTLTCTRSTLASQAVWTIQFTGKGGASGTANTIARIVAAGNVDSNPANDSSTKKHHRHQRRQPGRVKSGPASAVSGDVVDFKIVVTNVDGPDASGAFRVTDTLPNAADFTYQSYSGAGWNCSAAGATLTCDNPGPLSVGAWPPTSSSAAAS